VQGLGVRLIIVKSEEIRDSLSPDFVFGAFTGRLIARRIYE